MPTASTIAALLSQVMAGIIAFWFSRANSQDRARIGDWALSWTPSVIMVVAFLLDPAGIKVLTFGVLIFSLAFSCLAGLCIRRLARHPGSLRIAGLWAVVTVSGVLFTFGSLLQVRLDYQRNPASGPFDGSSESLWEFAKSQGTPLVVLAAAAGGILGAPFLRALAQGHLPDRLRGWFTPPFSRLRGRVSILPLPRARSIGLVAAVAAFFLPLLGPATNGAHLTFLGVQTGEWARPLWILTTAYVLARYRHYARWQSLIRMEPSGVAFSVSLSALIVGVAVAGWLRSDFGMVLPMVFAAPAMILMLSHRDRDAWLSSIGHPDSLTASPLTSATARKVGIVALALGSVAILLLVNFAIPGLKGRQDAWRDPWQFAWTIECTTTHRVPAWISPGPGYTDRVPDGYELCMELQREAIDSDNSQTARALTVVDGGGLWGRGLSDTEARIVPVRNSDFILASVWSKFGGLTAFLSTMLVIVLSYLLTRKTSRASWEGRTDSRGDCASIYAAGLGGMLAGQAVYVLLATTNVVWLTGVPFPFLARGGQAMGGLVLGVAILVWLVQRTEPPIDSRSAPRLGGTAAPVPLMRRAGVAAIRSIGLHAAVLASTAALVVGIAIPFASWQSGNLDAGLTHTGVQDQLRGRGQAPLLAIHGQVSFAQERRSGSWFTPDGVEPPLALHDLFGVLRTDNGGTMGLLEATVGDQLQGGAVERTVKDRLSETPTASGASFDITIDPALQSAVAKAVRAPAGNGHRLPAGVVMLDATSGAIRALSTAPDALDPLAGRATEAEIAAWNDPRLRNSAWGEVVGDTIREPGTADCNTAGVRCGRYRLRAKAEPLRDEEYLRTYVGGSGSFDLPNPAQNRAVGRRYNLGSTFKVVIAAAYLEAGGRVTDRIPSPEYVEVGGRLIGPQCRTTRDGKITVADALRVSCNPAFIQLARDLGWKSIAPTAQKLGFTLVGRKDAAADQSLWPAAAHVPATVDDQSIGTNSIGGDLVASTPLQLAAMMGPIVNGGTYFTPYLVESVSHNGERSRKPTPDGAKALSAATVDQLKSALAKTSGEGGTLNDVEYDRSKVRFYGKTGTHLARAESTSGQYTARYFWIVGAAEKVQGNGHPVSFAIVVEGKDSQLGRKQVRALATSILKSYAESER